MLGLYISFVLFSFRMHSHCWWFVVLSSFLIGRVVIFQGRLFCSGIFNIMVLFVLYFGQARPRWLTVESWSYFSIVLFFILYAQSLLMICCVVIFPGRSCCYLSRHIVLFSGKSRFVRFSNKDLHSGFLSRRYLIHSGRLCSHGTSALVGCTVNADDLLCCHLSRQVVLSSF